MPLWKGLDKCGLCNAQNLQIIAVPWDSDLAYPVSPQHTAFCELSHFSIPVRLRCPIKALDVSTGASGCALTFNGSKEAERAFWLLSSSCKYPQSQTSCRNRLCAFLLQSHCFIKINDEATVYANTDPCLAWSWIWKDMPRSCIYQKGHRGSK